MSDQPRLSVVVQGVECLISIHGVTLKVIALGNELEEVFGADPDPVSWLDAFGQHLGAVKCAARHRYSQRAGRTLVLTRSDFDSVPGRRHGS